MKRSAWRTAFALAATLIVGCAPAAAPAAPTAAVTATTAAPSTAAPVAVKPSDYPTRPIEIIVPTAPGGGLDLLTRELAKSLEKTLGTRIIIQNVGGASGTVGTSQAAKARPDGYTLMAGYIGGMTIAPHLIKTDYTLDSFAPITQISFLGMPLLAGPAKPELKTWDDVVTYAKAHPNELTYGTAGVGDLSHLAAERIFQTFGIKLKMVPFDGAGPSMAAVLGGHVDLSVGAVSTALPQVEAGKVRAVLMMSSRPVESLKGAVTLKDLGKPEVATDGWRGLFAPKGTPEAIVNWLQQATLEAMRDPAFVTLMERKGETLAPLVGDDFKKQLTAEYKEFGIILTALGMQPK